MNIKNREVTLLLIEDDDVDAMTVERSLRKKKVGNNIVRALDGIHALEILNEKNLSPFIILLDLQLPRMNGLEFLNEIRSHKKYSKSVVFILTTSKDEYDISESYKHSVAGYFVKDEVGENFMNVIGMLDSYWKIVHLPEVS